MSVFLICAGLLIGLTVVAMATSPGIATLLAVGGFLAYYFAHRPQRN